MNYISCYLCGSKTAELRKGRVRDSAGIKILTCVDCTMVYLSSIDHIHDDFYRDSGMHGSQSEPIKNWLKDTAWDDRRRFDLLRAGLPNKRILDFGCGAGGFLLLAKELASEVMGVEIEIRVRDYWAGKLEIAPTIEYFGEKRYDLITAFHVLEHLRDPRTTLQELAELLDPDGKLVIEVPNSEDALLTLYDCSAFQDFTYWSQHLYLFNGNTLSLLAKQAGLRVTSVQHYQRYPLSNHLYWLSKNMPGGHQQWAFMDSTELTAAYSSVLAAHGKTDTLIAYLERND
jgi:2-polyprenyl-3-methyl-5-hydroxy-6-metoxy-1,4-benzoquinol methylase